MNPDHFYHLAELSAVFLLVWRGNRILNRFYDVLKDYPPHKHVNGVILYPKDFEPGKMESIVTSRESRA